MWGDEDVTPHNRKVNEKLKMLVSLRRPDEFKHKSHPVSPGGGGLQSIEVKLE